MPEFELTTSVFTLEELKNADFSPYDAVYLGDPFCREYPENLAENFKDLEKAAALLKEQGKKVYLSTFSVPRNDDLKAVSRTLAKAGDLKLNGVEIHNFGVLRLCRREFPELTVQIGSLANLYTLATALLLKEEGVKRITPNLELCLEEIKEIKAQSGLEVELLIHGKMLLGISEYCLLKKQLKKENPPDCKELCRGNYLLTSRQMALKSFGRVTLSGKSLCMIEHLPELLKAGFKFFRIESFSEPREYVGEVGKIYRQALNRALKAGYPALQFLAELSPSSPLGFCNGYYFARSGQDYVCG